MLTGRVPSLGYESIDRVRIADINFSFKNGVLIKTLKNRGLCIQNNDWAGLKRVNLELDRVKNDNHKDLIVPTSAFITFESEEGLQRCLAIKDPKYYNVTLLGERPKVKSAPEPTNIIWENREVTKLSRFFRMALVVLIVVIILAFAFTVMVNLKKKALAANNKYLKQDCGEISSIYGGNLTQDYAVDEWFTYYQPGPNEKKKERISGVLDCFCQEQKKIYGFGVGQVVYDDREENQRAPICSEWLQDIYRVKAVGITISTGINVMNVIFKLLLVKLVEFVRQDTKSAQMTTIKVGVFTTQFFITGLLLLISGINMSESEFPLLKEYFRGPYTDFNNQWFRDLSPIIVMAMLIGAFMPIVEFGINWAKF